MRKFVAGLVAGLVLATAATAGAYSAYWSGSGKFYTCSGVPSGASCYLKGTNVHVSMLGATDRNGPSANVFIGKSVVFGCTQWADPSLGRCIDFRQ